MVNELEWYWQSIPVGKQFAVSYGWLERIWGMSERRVRKMLAELSGFDNGDNYILIRSSRGGGFYRTDDPADIAAYKRECHSRASKTFVPLKKINKVLRRLNVANGINGSFLNNIQSIRMERGVSQVELCRRLRESGVVADVSLLSKIENGYAMPTPAQLSVMADVLACDPSELIGIDYALVCE